MPTERDAGREVPAFLLVVHAELLRQSALGGRSLLFSSRYLPEEVGLHVT